MSLLDKIKFSFSFVSLGSIILGLILLLFPTISTKIICIVLGAWTLGLGIFKLVRYFRSNYETVLIRGGFISGFLLCGLGLFFIFKPMLITSILPFIIGLLVCFNSLIKLQSALELRRINYGKWGISLATAILGIILGLILIFNPFSGVKLAVMAIGITLIVDGISNICTDRMVKSNVGHGIDYFDIR